MDQQPEARGVGTDQIPWQAWEQMARLVKQIGFLTFLENEKALAGTYTEKKLVLEFMLRTEVKIQVLEAKVNCLIKHADTADLIPIPEAERLAVGCPSVHEPDRSPLVGAEVRATV